jgi:hypothetical protein
VHLKLKSNIQFVRQDPFDDLTRINPAKDRREEHSVTAGGKIVALHFVA